MAYDNVIQYGATYEFGIKSADAPVIPGMNVTKIQVGYAPEVNVKSQNGEGKTDSRVVDKPEDFDIRVKVTGRITDLDAFASTAANFTWRSRYFVIDGKSEPRERGAYVEADCDAESNVLIEGPAS